ncbi:hypothetical protein GUITHDRAFT_101827 [Guillardia theta CCMP2712]|uniref:WW domain-containing protein n=1 Tax=Guillardia theta (strain CCMP2712) TaxID=905079 RepID=L1JVQ6_GUITC|nr:hypothetical protein GUITHDRAFT_101827 [Guillardia theta CCMP2712]EKX52666.1 hypothetical protein GUITHDRAFT_101827 [Guillardia theta CCMP2712]|eukprot:XP_005839646.1 hypothetical protein GUITHDRAFT_101827 [Guillardia theta CCMP2712]
MNGGEDEKGLKFIQGHLTKVAFTVEAEPKVQRRETEMVVETAEHRKDKLHMYSDLKWKQLKDPKGQLYYWNTKSNKTQWEKPKCVKSHCDFH